MTWPGLTRLQVAQHSPSIETLLELSRKLRLKMWIEAPPEPGLLVKVTKAKGVIKIRAGPAESRSRGTCAVLPFSNPSA